MSNETNPRPPRISRIHKQIESQGEKIHEVLNSSDKMQKTSKNQLWDLCRLMLGLINDITTKLGSPPSDVAALMNNAPVYSTADIVQMLKKLENLQSNQNK